MAALDATHQLEGTVQLDNVYFGGERTGGKAVLDAENKVSFVDAVSLTEQGHPLHLKLTIVRGFALEAVGKWAKPARLRVPAS